MLLLVWLVFGLTATVHAAPAACTMAGMKHESSAPVNATAMPCCGQPAVAATADPAVLTDRPLEPARLFPRPTTVLVGRPVAAEPRPPKPLLNA